MPSEAARMAITVAVHAAIEARTLGIGEIAGRVGYESEAAFNRAFRCLVGSPPAAWRHAEGAPQG
jgi:AraC-like DNA-binding protein